MLWSRWSALARGRTYSVAGRSCPHPREPCGRFAARVERVL